MNMKRLADRDLLTALMLFGVSALFSVGSSSDPKDWAFPLLANYVTLGIAIAFLAKFIIAVVLKHLPDLLEMTADDRASLVDVVVFMLRRNWVRGPGRSGRAFRPGRPTCHPRKLLRSCGPGPCEWGWQASG